MVKFRALDCDPLQENFDVHYFLAAILPDLRWTYLGSAQASDSGWDIRIRENQREKLVELEFRSSSYRRDHALHSHPRRADYVVVWDNDDPAIEREYGVKVLSLSERIQEMPANYYPQVQPQGGEWTKSDFIRMSKPLKEVLWILAHTPQALNQGYLYTETLDYLLGKEQSRVTTSRIISGLMRSRKHAPLIMQRSERRGWVAGYGASGFRWAIYPQYLDLIKQALRNDADIVELRERLLEKKQRGENLSDLMGLHADNQQDIKFFLSSFAP